MQASPEIDDLPWKTAAVRDLAWSCFSPCLLRAGALGEDVGSARFSLDAQRREWLAALDADPTPLLSALGESAGGRLGLYFERLWQFFLAADPALELVAHNLPVRAGGRTLGEYDVIYYCHRRRRHVHLELALKFYLLRQGAADPQWRHWLGPNSRDRLDLKLGRLRDHQLRLADTGAGRDALLALGVQEVLRESAVRGRLFRHISEPDRLPPGVQPGLRLQRWLRESELAALPGNTSWVPLERHQWLAPIARNTPSATVGARYAGDAPVGARYAGDRPQSGLLQRPLQLAALDARGREIERVFVVPDQWPNT